MRLTTILGLTATAALVVMAFVGASSAAAKYSTALCLADTVALPCEGGPPEGEGEPPVIHLEDKTAVLKTTTPALTITCEALIEGENLGLAEAPNPLEVHVPVEGLKYANCNKGCSAKNELAGVILVLKTGPEVATVTSDGFKVRLTCGVIVDCKYNAVGLVLHGLGALLAGPNGAASTTEASITKEGGGVCPATAKLTVEYVPLVPLYIRAAGISGGTALCLADTVALPCEGGPPEGEGEPPVIHLEDKTAVLKTTTPALTITCEALIEGENLGLAEAPNPLEVHVPVEGLKYANCNKGCSAKNELAGVILVLKTGPEVATVTSDGFKVRLTCGVIVDCKYNAVGLVLHGLGALLAGPNGAASTTEASITKEGGGVCPATAKLTVEYVPLVPLYIRS